MFFRIKNNLKLFSIIMTMVAIFSKEEILFAVSKANNFKKQNANLFNETNENLSFEKAPKINYVRSLDELKPSLTLPLTAKTESIQKPLSKVKQRIIRSKEDERIEPIQIALSKNASREQIWQKAQSIALPGQTKKIYNFLKNTMVKIQNPADKSATLRIPIEANLMKYIDLNSLSAFFTTSHQDLSLDTLALNRNLESRSALINQVQPFLNKQERKQLITALDSGNPLLVDEVLLPSFARTMVKKFTIYRGPNCFHASLAFQNPQLPKADFVNIKEEEGYHRAMINYDELWLTLQNKFYEIDPKTSPLKYGDILVFLDTSSAKSDSSPVNFRWIRHAAAYLFNDYTFSKGSKSPNTPYTVKTLESEWTTWASYTKKLGVKVFRRNKTNGWQNQATTKLTDWLY
ncbi:MAG: hypothetical protein KBD78_01410 [Oligoflexales bacterium]|nr:hypothetical protein [Oligoflexales bacterium]